MKGIYILIIQLNKNVDVTVGKLGKLSFQKGFYAYVGSAQTNLEKRIKRHHRKEKRMFWHIDYLLQNPNSKIVKIYHRTANKPEECITAHMIAAEGEFVAGFGCSDCQCKSHLFHIKDYDFLRESMQEYVPPNLSTVS